MLNRPSATVRILILKFLVVVEQFSMFVLHEQKVGCLKVQPFCRLCEKSDC